MQPLCLNCGEELRRKGIMQPVELKLICWLLGRRTGHRRSLTQEAFAQLLGISVRSLRHYLNGERRIPAPVAKEARRLREQSRPRKKAGTE
jgi:hypothetical protein